MASSEDNPTAAEEKSTSQGDSSEGGAAQNSPSGRSKKKTLLGLGKLRESLKKSSPEKKTGSLRIPKPASRKRKKTSLGLPKPLQSGDDDASERTAPEKRTTLTLDPDEPDEADKAVYHGPTTDRIGQHDEAADDGPLTDRIDEPDEVTDEELSTDRIDEPDEVTDEELSTDRIEQTSEVDELDVDDIDELGAASTDRIEQTSEVDELDVDDIIEVEADHDDPTADRIDEADEGPSTDQMSASELGRSMPHLATPDASVGSPSAGQSGGPDDSGLLEDVELDHGEVPAEPMAEEATMLSDSPFGAQPADAVDQAENSDGFGAEPADMSFDEEVADDFGAESTVITDSPLGVDPADAAADGESGDFAGGKTTVSQPDNAAGASSLPPGGLRDTDGSHPNPPTPEQKPRGANFSTGAAPSPGLHTEASLEEDSDAADDDFHAEKTEVFDSPYEHEALVPRLSSLGGPAAGQEFLLNKQRNTIGRGKNNTIMIADLAMSRQHFEIVENNDQTYTLIDLQSANGTQLNNTRIEEAELLHGDRIEAGKTEFQFVVPGDRPTPRSQHRRIVPKRDVRTPGENTMVGHSPAHKASRDDPTDKLLTVVIIGAGALSVVLFGVAIYLFFADGDQQQAAQAQAPVVQASDAQARYLEGVEEVKARNWQTARDIFEDVAQMQPDFPGVDAQLVRVAREANTLSTLEQARASLDDGDDQRAARLARAISNESVYYEQAQQLLRQTRQRRITVLYQRAQEAATAEELDEARAHLDEILEEVPNHEGALELRRSLDEEADQEDTSSDADQPRASAKPTTRASTDSDWLTSSSSSSSRPAQDTPKTRVNFTRGFTLYKDGDFDEAIAHFRSVADSVDGSVGQRANRTAESIEKFAATYASATRAFEAGAWKRAIDGLGNASTLDRAVARSGYFSSQIHAKLGTAHGKVGLAAFEEGDYRTAYRHYTRGKRYAAGDSTVNTLRRSLSNQARSLYIQAANKRKADPDQAAALCRQITKMVPATHSMHRKAKLMLEEIQ